MPAHLTGVGQLVQPGYLALALEAGRMIGGQVANQPADPFAQLKGKVRGGGTHQLAHVVHGDLAAREQSIWVLGLAHDTYFCGTASSS